MTIRRVDLSRLAKKQLKKLPKHIVENLAAWVDGVETRGLEEVRLKSSFEFLATTTSPYWAIGWGSGRSD